MDKRGLLLVGNLAIDVTDRKVASNGGDGIDLHRECIELPCSEPRRLSYLAALADETLQYMNGQ